MWRAPTESHEGSSDAAGPQRSRWLDIVNLVVSILILAIFIWLIPLLTAERDRQLLADRVTRLEERIAVLEARADALSGSTGLALGRLDMAPSQGSASAAGFWIRNTGSAAARDVRVVVALDAVAPPWNQALDSIHRLAVRTYPSSLEVVTQTQQIPTMPQQLGGPGILGDNALELTLDTLAPGGEWVIVVELASDLPVETCRVAWSGSVEVRPSRFAPLSLSADALEVLQYGLGRRLREGVEQHGWLADLAVTAECLNCGAAERATARLSALSALLSIRSTPARLLEDAGTGYAAAWDTTVSATLSVPSGGPLPDYCVADAALFQDASLFGVYPGRIFSYAFSPTSAASAQ